MHHTFTPTDVTENSGYVDQSINSQCSVLLQFRKGKLKTSFHAAVTSLFPGLLLPKSKLNTSQMQDRRRHAGFSTNLVFWLFRPILKIKLNKNFPQNLEIPGSCYKYKGPKLWHFCICFPSLKCFQCGNRPAINVSNNYDIFINNNIFNSNAICSWSYLTAFMIIF